MAGILGKLGRKRFVSLSALAAVLQELASAESLPSAISRSSIKRAREAEWAEAQTPYGEVIGTAEIGNDKNGNPLSFHVVNPMSNLYYFIRQCPQLQTFMRDKLLETPCSPQKPWTIVYYGDEVVCGNVLKHENLRKLQAVYWSFKEFGSAALCSEFLWFTLSLNRSHRVQQLTGGMGQYTKHMMLSFGSNSSDKSFQTIGFVCGDIIIWARIGITVSDEAALKSFLDFKGASGTVPCLECRNCVQHRSAYAKADKTGKLVSIACSDVKLLIRHTDTTLLANIAYLESQKLVLGKGAFDTLCQTLGLNFNPLGVMKCSELMAVYKPIQSLMFDWMHCVLVNGTWNHEVGLLLDRLKKECNIKHEQVNDFFGFYMASTTWRPKWYREDCAPKAIGNKENYTV
jgi:hypothetical protein